MINPILNKIFHRYRERIIDREELGEYSGGYYSSMIRKEGSRVVATVKGTILDLGCGEGLVIDSIRNAGFEGKIIGVDPWIDILNRLIERRSNDKNITLIQGSGLNIPLESNSVDGVSCLNLLLNLEDYSTVKRTIGECFRVLKPGGIMVFDVRNRWNFLHLIRYKLANIYDDTLKTPLNTYFPFKIEQMVKEMGFGIMKKIPIGFPETSLFSPIYLFVLKKYPEMGSNTGRLIPPVSLPVKISDGVRLWVKKKKELCEVEKNLSLYFGSKVKLVGSGQVALYLILKGYSRLIPGKNEVIMPSYTAPSVYVTIKSGGLKPKIVDIVPNTMKYDVEKLKYAIGPNTLAILNIHPFGIGINPEYIREIPHVAEMKIPIIEDNAQGLGIKIYDKYAGTCTEAGFSSFNRGKNMPTEGGGIIFVRNRELADTISSMVDELPLSSFKKKDLLPIFTILYSLAVRPEIYGPMQRIIGRFKQTAPPSGTELMEYTREQATLLAMLMPRLERWNREKLKRANIYLSHFREVENISTIRVERGVLPAFNRFPVLCENIELRDKLENQLKKFGVEASSLYIKSIAEHFGEDTKDLENGVEFSRKLLTLPLQPSLTTDEIKNIAEIVKFVCRGN
jgi:dTDP-4-amino-4,6-dideoxygalactose transaminase/ubiquinone/menaquinone biosynthesis C-methylase UbiE